MDRNFHTDDFERLLREKSDEFRMYPSKRIWYSIYNNIHPGRKWPSVAMSIILITSLFLIGYLNTNNTNQYSETVESSLVQKVIDNQNVPIFVSQSIPNIQKNINENAPTLQNNGNSVPAGNSVNYNNVKDNLIGKPLFSTSHSLIKQSSIADNNSINADKSGVDINNFTNNKTVNIFIEEINKSVGSTNGQIEGDFKISVVDDQFGSIANFRRLSNEDFIEYVSSNNLKVKNDKKIITISTENRNSIVNKNNLLVNKNNVISIEDKNWIENYASYNRPAPRKWINKLALQLYATPSVVYRRLNTDMDLGNTISATPFAISNSNQDINTVVNQKPSLGFEIGSGFHYAILKGVKLKAGLQLNYTRYNAEAFQNTHPVTTKLTLHDFKTNTTYQEYRSTPYTNKSGLESVSLHNETFQISLPVGADIKLIGNRNLQWNIGATIQPTYLAGGKSYLISSDRVNYVKEASMLNRWNLNAGLETYITFKADGLTWQIGPQFRTQLFSTNNRKFTVQERLVNYGLKFGVSKILK